MNRWLIVVLLVLLVMSDVLTAMSGFWPAGYNSALNAIDLCRGWIQANLLIFYLGGFTITLVGMLGIALYKATLPQRDR